MTLVGVAIILDDTVVFPATAKGDSYHKAPEILARIIRASLSVPARATRCGFISGAGTRYPHLFCFPYKGVQTTS
ncbi:hypothetical protein DACRYDRAFT_25616 [Dacryopinax primogenitus]|uniref:Uncharacterized protein n=1 Tax=Dacryopinax primogenitus (strain DJM 731) TaxID=1858805 RepID=M5FTN5_DACPD|nr:uncharacterized protein DACRYDRAFT_25616 [Dacryopinax primogenitus]EJT96596.1 hypothetical protein DACRYDRAFT_25616 [Dacryopinax primogenitus]